MKKNKWNIQRPWLLALGLCLVGIGLQSHAQRLVWRPVGGKILTRWAKDVSPENVHSEYPRPQMVREEWLNLNGLWNYAIRPVEEGEPAEYDGKILVPFPIESSLSGVHKAVGAKNRLWYQRTFVLPKTWKQKKILLNFEAVDWETNVWVNGIKVGSHRGGYDPFAFDISRALTKKGDQKIVVSVWDPTTQGTQPRGKQVLNPRGIWYTAVTGIWRTVWLEPVNQVHIHSLKIIPDIDTKSATIHAECKGNAIPYGIVVSVWDGKTIVARTGGRIGRQVRLTLPKPKLWSPDSPHLYKLEIKLEDGYGKDVDLVQSYFGMRKISLGEDASGIKRLFLNNRPLFQFGPLDQGWWPDGLYTAASDEALRYDVETTKELGFNMLRKHVKIEPRRFYYWCDTLGVLVWQDMPSGDIYIRRDDPDLDRSPESENQFMAELKCMLDTLYNHPSIVMWVPFNEGWGQFKTAAITSFIKEYDPTRLVNNTSGWADRGVGDVNDVHAYPGPAAPANEPNRAAVLGEFGGLGLPLSGHTWQAEENWGYRNYQNPEELTAAYLDLLSKLEVLIRSGLSAAVYTQTSDVEVEVNGLMTYDREVIKMDKEKVVAVNRSIIKWKDQP